MHLAGVKQPEGFKLNAASMSEEGGTGTVGKTRAEESRRNSVDARGERERGNGHAGAGTRKQQGGSATDCFDSIVKSVAMKGKHP